MKGPTNCSFRIKHDDGVLIPQYDTEMTFEEANDFINSFGIETILSCPHCKKDVFFILKGREDGTISMLSILKNNEGWFAYKLIKN